MQRQFLIKDQDPTQVEYWIKKIEVASGAQSKRGPDLHDAALVFVTGFAFFGFLLPNILSLFNNTAIQAALGKQEIHANERENFMTRQKTVQTKINQLLSFDFRSTHENEWYTNKCARETNYFWKKPENEETPVYCSVDQNTVNNWSNKCKEVYNTYCAQLRPLMKEDVAISGDINQLTQQIDQGCESLRAMRAKQNHTVLYTIIGFSVIAVGLIALIESYQSRNNKVLNATIGRLLNAEELAQFKNFLVQKNTVMLGIEQRNYREVVNYLKTASHMPASQSRQLYEVNPIHDVSKSPTRNVKISSENHGGSFRFKGSQ